MFSVLLFEIPSLQSSNRCAHLHESHRTLRDGSLGWRCPRQFVLVLVLVLVLDTCRNGLQSVEYNINLCYVLKWSQHLITKNSTFTDSNCSLLPGLPIFSKRFRNRRSRTGASCMISWIEPAYPFFSIPPKETENARAFKEPDTSMTPAAQPSNVRRAWTPPWPSESQRAIESFLAKSYWPGL